MKFGKVFIFGSSKFAFIIQIFAKRSEVERAPHFAPKNEERLILWARPWLHHCIQIPKNGISLQIEWIVEYTYNLVFACSLF